MARRWADLRCGGVKQPDDLRVPLPLGNAQSCLAILRGGGRVEIWGRLRGNLALPPVAEESRQGDMAEIWGEDVGERGEM